jgi:hypothetical protein
MCRRRRPGDLADVAGDQSGVGGGVRGGGTGKTDVLAEVLTGPRDPDRLPSQLIRPANGKLLFLLDEAAAAKLPPAEATGAGYRLGCLRFSNVVRSEDGGGG